jgi:hypothetical protein
LLTKVSSRMAPSLTKDFSTKTNFNLLISMDPTLLLPRTNFTKLFWCNLHHCQRKN